MRVWIGFVLLTALSRQSGQASANGAVSEFAAGGVIFHDATEIAIAREDLFVSPNLVRVSYVYRSDSTKTQNVGSQRSCANFDC